MNGKGLHIEQLDSSGFYQLPSIIYEADVLPMVPNKVNPRNFKTAFLIEGQGRVVVYENPDMQLAGKRAISLGYFECVNNPNVANELLKLVENFARQVGAIWLIGPMNGSTWDNYRYRITHDSPLFFTEPYHHLYYNELWTKSGFKTIANYSSSIDKQLKLVEPERMLSWLRILEDLGVVIRPINMKDYEGEIEKIHGLCTEIFKNNFLYTPISEKEFIQKYLPFKTIMDEDLVLIAEDSKKNPVGVLFGIPDFYNKTIPTVIWKTIARNPQRHYAGMMHVMANMALEKSKQKGYRQIIHAFMHENNHSTSMSVKFSGNVFRQYALYAKAIGL